MTPSSQEPKSIDEKTLANEWLRGLMSLGEYGFPKACPACGKVYHSLSELLRQNEVGLKSSGVIQDQAEERQPLVGFHSRCQCGAKIAGLFKDRRDQSPEGLMWRETFGELLEAFKAVGVPTEQARQELLQALRGKDLETLRKFRNNALLFPPEKFNNVL